MALKFSGATLHNDDEIKRKDIRVGDRVEIQRAGDVIPQITRSIDAETRAEYPREIFTFPANCPVCDSKTVRVQDEAAIRCPNFQCPAQQIEAMKHLVSRDAFNIDGLGEQAIKIIYRKRLFNQSSRYFQAVSAS